ncbi:hypothetical protein QFW77_00865 [Luteimonas sp. RD2P54]|uniref:Uncharacterized protein n=1 Tax=Luteimonas endophytica TaxID=3042023 RepID=A0ABT6J401_9GAMM|nr:hypothetical protein [Luteimonas endophytica]MDH5821546.1 hypothetical protein [Luteimonas endophytica]
MNLDAEKWSLLEKAHDYRFLLRLFAFALVTDLVLSWGTGVSLFRMGLNEFGARPGLLVLAVLAYGLTMTVGAGLLRFLAVEVLGTLVITVQGWFGWFPGRKTPDAARFVSWSQAEAWLAEQPDADRRQHVKEQMAERRLERKRWFSMVGAGWACIALIAWNATIPDSSVSILGHWNAWAPWVLMGVPGLPCAYHLIGGMPGHDYIELPELAEQIRRERVPHFRARADVPRASRTREDPNETWPSHTLDRRPTPGCAITAGHRPGLDCVRGRVRPLRTRSTST